MMTGRFVTRATAVGSVLHFDRSKALPLVLAMCSAFFAVSANALEVLSEDGMSDATGEGLAMFYQNFQLQMPSVAGDSDKSSGSVPATDTFGTGVASGSGCSGTNPGGCGSFIYLSPVGPIPTSNVTGNKTDLYIYGLSISENNNLTVNTAAANFLGSAVVPAGASTGATSHNALFNNAANATSGGQQGVNWGLATDPFTLSVKTTPNQVSLGGLNATVPYLEIAAPTTITTSSANASFSSNNIRLGLWTNIMQYDGAVVNTSPTATSSGGGAGPALQLQGIWDGFGMNGTVVDMFPTSACSTANCPYGTTGSSAGAAGTTLTSSSHGEYTNTLGLAGFLRFNSQPQGVLRFSVAQSSLGVFDAYEGLYLQNVHSNLPIGDINFQPLVLSSGVQGSGATATPTLSLELAQIPNIKTIYNQVYIDYNSGATGALTPAQGMCSSTSCPVTATHGNITIGDVFVNSSASTVAPVYTLTQAGYTTATVSVTDSVPSGGSNALFINSYSGSGSTTSFMANSGVAGVTFKSPGATGATVNLGTASISGLSINHLKMTLTGL